MPVEVYERTFLPLNIHNVMDQCYLAQDGGSDDQIYFTTDEQFHAVEVTYDVIGDEFTLLVNGIEMGDFANKGEVYEQIGKCI